MLTSCDIALTNRAGGCGLFDWSVAREEFPLPFVLLLQSRDMMSTTVTLAGGSPKYMGTG